MLVKSDLPVHCCAQHPKLFAVTAAMITLALSLRGETGVQISLQPVWLRDGCMGTVVQALLFYWRGIRHLTNMTFRNFFLYVVTKA